MPVLVEGAVTSAVGRTSFVTTRQTRLPEVGCRTDMVRLGYRSGIPPLLSAHRATPGWLKPTGEYVMLSTDEELAEIADTTFEDSFTAAIAVIGTFKVKDCHLRPNVETRRANKFAICSAETGFLNLGKVKLGKPPTGVL